MLKRAYLAAIALAPLSFPSVGRAGGTCEATVECILEWQGHTILLPDTVASLSSKVGHCAPLRINSQHDPSQMDPVSVFFLIDHSASMSIIDSNSLRYSVVAQVIDSLSVLSPLSEVGMAVFSNQLLHSHDSTTYAVPFPSLHDSYIPLVNLTQDYSGLTGAEMLKQAIALSPTEKDPGGMPRLENGYYGPTGRHVAVVGQDLGYSGGTDISLAFEAAKEAFKSATWPKDRHIIILISDGIAQNVDQEREGALGTYIEGLDMAATYTVFLTPTPTWSVLPAEIVEMTQNTRDNGYSAANGSSHAWATPACEDSLFALIMFAATGGMSATIGSYLSGVSINNSVATSIDTAWAYFPGPFSLTPQAVTAFNVMFIRHYDWPLESDSATSFQLALETQPGASVPAGVSIQCTQQQEIQLQSAITRDFNANGYLDAVELRFNAPVTFADTFNLQNIAVAYPLDSSNTRFLMFTTDSLAPLGSPDTVFVVYLQENSSMLSGSAQTGWRPVVSIEGHSEVSATRFESTDGAGPVLWKISPSAGSLESFTVTFSEPVVDENGNPFTMAVRPSAIFNTWLVIGRDTTLADSSWLPFEDTVLAVGPDSLVLKTSGEAVVTGEFLLSIRTSPAAMLTDTNGNGPSDHNPRVRLSAYGTSTDITVYPDNLVAVRSHFENHLICRDPGEAYQWARDDGGIAVFVPFDLPTVMTAQVRAALVVCDAAGNSVYGRTANDIIPQSWRDGLVAAGTRQMAFYWNGITDDNKAARGTYQITVALKPSDGPDAVYAASVEAGGAEGDNACGNCGSGVYMALLPAFGAGLGSYLRKRKG